MPSAAIHRGVVGACLVVVVGIVGAAAAAVTQTSPAANAPASAPPAGRAIYNARCATCHGSTGMGDGPVAAELNAPPRDFARGVYKFRSTASGSLPSDADLLKVVADGVPGTSMIGWKDLLSVQEQQAVVEYVKLFSPRFASESPKPLPLAPEPPDDATSVEAGRQVYATLQCGACHGDAGQLASAVAGTLEDDWGKPLKTAELTEPWTFKGGSTARDIAIRVKAGIDGTPMPGVADLATDADIWHLAHYVRSLARKPVWEMSGDELKAHYARQDEHNAAAPVERGRQLAEACAHCHSPVDKDGAIIPGMKFAGGMRIRLAVWGDAVTANLTSDKETGLGRYTDAEILSAVTRGIRRDGSRMLPFPMGWTAWAHLAQADQQALVAYLRTIPPVRNQIPARAHPGFFTYLADKFRMLILGADDPVLLYSGNAGTLSEGQVKQ